MKIKGTLVLLHGFGMHQGVWDQMIPYLGQGAAVKVPDMSRLTFEDLEDYVQWLYHYIENERVSDPILVGFSMGGYIALGFAEKYPKLVKGLVLFHSSAMADSEARKMARQKTVEFIKKNGAPLFLEEFHPKIFSSTFQQNFPDQVRQFALDHGQLDPDVLIAGTQAMKGRKGRMHILTTLSIPIGMVIGGQDAFIAKEDALQQVGIMQKPYVLMLESVGHAAMIEAPDICASFLIYFTHQCI